MQRKTCQKDNIDLSRADSFKLIRYMLMTNTLKFIFAEAIILIVWHLLLELGLNPVQILGLLIPNQYLLLCIDTIVISLLTTTLATHTLKWNNWRVWIVSITLIIVISSLSAEPFFSFCTTFNVDVNIFCQLFAFNVLIQVFYIIIYILLNILCHKIKVKALTVYSLLFLMSSMDGFAKLLEQYTHTSYSAFHLDYHFDGGYMSVRPSYGATPPGQAPVYYANCHYFIHDYQSNNRLVVDGSDNIEQTNEYYPYGGPWGTSSTNQAFQPYKYNGRSALCDASHLKKELDRVHGLDWYDYDARRYDPAYCMFTQMDPLAEKIPLNIKNAHFIEDFRP